MYTHVHVLLVQIYVFVVVYLDTRSFYTLRKNGLKYLPFGKLVWMFEQFGTRQTPQNRLWSNTKAQL